MELKDKLKLNLGEQLIQVSHKMKGSLGETDIYKYEIIDSTGSIIGYVDHTDHTSIRGFNRTRSTTQYDANNKIVLDIHW